VGREVGRTSHYRCDISGFGVSPDLEPFKLRPHLEPLGVPYLARFSRDVGFHSPFS
jgi:hypothetical protein